MTQHLHSPGLQPLAARQPPERIHPSLWRGTQLAHAYEKTVPTGYPALNSELPGQGWPTGTLIELMPERPGVGEIQLLKPALLQLQAEGRIMVLNPPHTPSAL